MKLKPDQVGRAGEAFVVAELLRRGGCAVSFSGNMPGIDIIASDARHKKKITIQVKSRSGGTRQTSIKRGRSWHGNPHDDRFWVLVDLAPEHPAYYVMPAYWIENNIHETHKAYLARNAGTRKFSPESTHHAITTRRVAKWRDRWDVSGSSRLTRDDHPSNQRGLGEQPQSLRPVPVQSACQPCSRAV